MSSCKFPVGKPPDSDEKYLAIHPTNNPHVFCCSVCKNYYRKVGISLHMTRKHKAKVYIEGTAPEQTNEHFKEPPVKANTSTFTQNNDATLPGVIIVYKTSNPNVYLCSMCKKYKKRTGFKNHVCVRKNPLKHLIFFEDKLQEGKITVSSEIGNPFAVGLDNQKVSEERVSRIEIPSCSNEAIGLENIPDLGTDVLGGITDLDSSSLVKVEVKEELHSNEIEEDIKVDPNSLVKVEIKEEPSDLLELRTDPNLILSGNFLQTPISDSINKNIMLPGTGTMVIDDESSQGSQLQSSSDNDEYLSKMKIISTIYNTKIILFRTSNPNIYLCSQCNQLNWKSHSCTKGTPQEDIVVFNEEKKIDHSKQIALYTTSNPYVKLCASCGRHWRNWRNHLCIRLAPQKKVVILTHGDIVGNFQLSELEELHLNRTQGQTCDQSENCKLLVNSLNRRTITFHSNKNNELTETLQKGELDELEMLKLIKNKDRTKEQVAKYRHLLYSLNKKTFGCLSSQGSRTTRKILPKENKDSNENPDNILGHQQGTEVNQDTAKNDQTDIYDKMDLNCSNNVEYNNDNLTGINPIRILQSEEINNLLSSAEDDDSNSCDQDMTTEDLAQIDNFGGGSSKDTSEPITVFTTPNQKKFLCCACNKLWRKMALKRHAWRAHGTRNIKFVNRYTGENMNQLVETWSMKPPPKEKFSCNKCQWWGYSKYRLRAHVRSVHPEPFNCPTCLITFPNRQMKYMHMRKVHAQIKTIRPLLKLESNNLEKQRELESGNKWVA